MTNLKEYEKRVDLGLLSKQETEDLVLYNYTDKCVYEKAWDSYTLESRGIVFEKVTGRLVAKPFPKFFNLGEMSETRLENLPNESYVISEKMDGSLGIVYFYKDSWRVNTRGSFNSEQAIEATKMLQQYSLDLVPKHVTLLVEIIYPNNKIVVNYGQRRELVLLGAFDILNGEELPARDPHPTGMPVAPILTSSIEEAIAQKKILTKNEEGFIVKFKSGLRVKIKGDEYLRVHKLISQLSPLSLWEVMKNGKVDENYLKEIPEEFRTEWEPYKESLEFKYCQVLNEIENDLKKLPSNNKKDIGLFIQASNNDLKHPGAIFMYLSNNHDKYIMKTIRPTGNIL